MSKAKSHLSRVISPDQAVLLFQRVPADLACSSILLLLASVLTPTVGLLWLAVMATLVLIKSLLWWRYDSVRARQRGQARASALGRWGAIYVSIVGLSGLAWGWLGAAALAQGVSVIALLPVAAAFAAAIVVYIGIGAALLGHSAALLLPLAFAATSIGAALPVESAVGLGGIALVLALTLGVAVGGDRLAYQQLRLRREKHALLTQAEHDAAMLENTRQRLQAVAAERSSAEKALSDANQALEERQQSSTNLLQQDVTLDALTKLPNRHLLLDRLHQAIVKSNADHGELAVLRVNLDRFSRINDSLGHDIGDAVLQEIASRLRGCAGAADTVARFGADEFVIVLECSGVQSQATTLAQKVLAAVQTPVVLANNSAHVLVTGTIGVSRYPQDGRDVRSLLKCANIALQKAKTDLPNDVCCYHESMDNQSTQRLNLELALRGALERGELSLHYQPQIDISSGEVQGAEALLRWHHPLQGEINTGQLIALAEDTGLIVSIGEWVLASACTEAKRWHDMGFGHLRVAVNLSPRQFMQADLVEKIRIALVESGLPAHYLELEITEGMLMNDLSRAQRTLRELKNLGVCLAIDDFGTGYSSLAYLKRFAVDVLKIDRSFVIDLPNSSDDAAIVSAVIALSHTLGLKVVVEGIETDLQLTFVDEHHADLAQGYLFSRPLPPAEFTRMMQRRQVAALAAAMPEPLRASA